MEQKSIINVWHDFPAYDSRIRYVFAFIANHPATGNQVDFRFNEVAGVSNKQLYYQEISRPFIPSANAYLIPAQKVLFSLGRTSTRELTSNTYISNSTTIYSAELVKHPPQEFVINKVFQFDWIEMIFFHISRFEEYHCPSHMWDEWDMMKEELHFLVRHELDKIPVVDHLVFCILRILGIEPVRARTKVQMSHDIDVLEKHTSLYKLGRAWAKLLINGKGWRVQGRLFKSFIEKKLGKQKDPYDSFDHLLSTSKQEEKIIYLMAGGLTRYDNLYQLTDPKVENIITLARNHNYKIGLHPSYETHTNEHQFKLEKDRLEHLLQHKVLHCRQHFLHFSFKETPYILEKSGIRFDSTLGYQNRFGFRCGTGFPYKLFCFGEERAFEFWENPMVLMDVGWLREYDYDFHKAQAFLHEFLRTNAELTQITLNFHNTIFDDIMYNGDEMRKAYRLLAGTTEL